MDPLGGGQCSGRLLPEQVGVLDRETREKRVEKVPWTPGLPSLVSCRPGLSNIHTELTCIVALAGRSLLPEIQEAFSKFEKVMKCKRGIQDSGI